MIIVYMLSDPTKVYATHLRSQEPDIIYTYPPSKYGAVKVPVALNLSHGDVVNVADGTALVLLG